MKFSSSFVLSLLTALAVGAGRVADAAPRSPVVTVKPGSVERKAIFDALRQPVSKACKTTVTFTKAEVKMSGGWAYVQAQTINSKGKPVGVDGQYNHMQALLSGKGKNWRVREWSYPSDVISISWEQKYPSVPKALWPHTKYSLSQ